MTQPLPLHEFCPMQPLLAVLHELWPLQLLPPIHFTLARWRDSPKSFARGLACSETSRRRPPPKPHL